MPITYMAKTLDFSIFMVLNYVILPKRKWVGLVAMRWVCKMWERVFEGGFHNLLDEKGESNKIPK